MTSDVNLDVHVATTAMTAAVMTAAVMTAAATLCQRHVHNNAFQPHVSWTTSTTRYMYTNARYISDAATISRKTREHTVLQPHFYTEASKETDDAQSEN